MSRNDVILLLSEVRERLHALQGEIHRCAGALSDEEREYFMRAVTAIDTNRQRLSAVLTSRDH